MTRSAILRAFAVTLLVTFAICTLIALACLSGCAKKAPVTPRPTFTAISHAVGTSMLPTFSASEDVALELCPFTSLASGDTVIFWHSDTSTYIHHRLDHFDTTTGRWITKGDNNPTSDRGILSSDQFIGRTHKLLAR